MPQCGSHNLSFRVALATRNLQVRTECRFLTTKVVRNDIGCRARKKSLTKRRPCWTSPAKLPSGPCVRALREVVTARTANYKGMTDTTRTPLNFWFKTDHKQETAFGNEIVDTNEPRRTQCGAPEFKSPASEAAPPLKVPKGNLA